MATKTTTGRTSRPRTRARVGPRVAPRRAGSRIRWDRVARVALLSVFAVVLLLYISPLSHWVSQSRTADAQKLELQRLQREHDRLAGRASELQRPDALEREARRLGMVKNGERPYVVEGTGAKR